MAKSGFACAVAALCLSGSAASAQTAPVRYWMPNLPIGFGGNLTAESWTAAGNAAADSGDAKGFSVRRFDFSSGAFAGSGIGPNGLGQPGALGAASFQYDSTQVGYNFKGLGGMPVTVFAGLDSLKYNPNIGNPFSPFDTTSSTATGYTAHAGVEIQPTSNLSLSLGVGYVQQPGLSSPLIGATPMGFGARR